MRVRLAFPFIVAFVLIASPLLAQEQTKSSRGVDVAGQDDDQTAQDKTAPIDDKVPSPGDAAQSGITVASVEAAQAAIEKDSSLDSSIKSPLLKQCNDAIEALKEATKYKALAEEYTTAITAAPNETARLKTELELLPSTDDAVAKAYARTIGLGSDDLQKEIDSLRTSLTGLNEDLAKFSAEQKRVTGSTAVIDDRLPKVESELIETQKKLTSVEFSTDPTSHLRVAERLVLQADESKLQNELEMRKQEQSSKSVREGLLTAQVNLLTRQVENADEVLKALEAAKNKKLMTEAQRIRSEVAAIIPTLPKDDSEVQKRAEEVQDLVTKLDDVVLNLQAVSKGQERVSTRLKRLTDEYDYVDSQLKLGGGGEVIGRLLFALRDRILTRGDNSDLTKNLPKLDASRLSELQINQEVRNRAEVEKQLADRSAESVVQLIATRSELLEILQTQNKTLVSGLSAIERDKQRYSAKAEEVFDYVSEQLFWIKSFPAISADSFTQLPSGIQWIFHSEHWQETGRTFSRMAMRAPVLFFGLLVFVTLLIIMRRRIIVALEKSGEQTRRISTDQYSESTKALLWTILLAAPVPLLFLLIWWTLGQATQSFEEDHWLRGMAIGSGQASWITLLLGFMIAASRPKGLGIVHFGWQEKPTIRFRTATVRFAAVYVPALFATACTLYGFDEDAEHVGSVGRISLILAHAWTAILIWQFFRSSDGLLASLVATHPNEFVTRFRHLWYALLLACPIVLIVLASLGYIITAFELSIGVLATLGIIAVGVILFYMALRWFLIKKRKLALAEAIERRKARLEAAAAADHKHESDEVISVDPEDDVKLDLDSIGEQTRHLLKMVFSLSVIVTIAVHWSETIPVFSALENIAVPLTGGLTLLALGKAALIVVVAWVAVQNLPGLLELSILRTTSIETGTRYAISRLGQYVVTAIGLILLFGVLNVDWSKFGWIAAALSVGLGFGLQEVVANFVCGLILLFERPVRLGDVVTLNGMTGTVTKIQMRATTITNWDRQEFIVPNKNLITGTILNWTLSASINRVVIPLGVAYGTDTELARKILLDVAVKHPLILDDPRPLTTFEQFADSSLTIVLRAYLPDLDNRLGTITELCTEIDRRFAEAGIEIAFPQHDIHIRADGNSLASLVRAEQEEFMK